MVLSEDCNNTNNNNNNNNNNNKMIENIGQTVRSVLIRAKFEDRLVIGLTEVAKNLSKTPEDAIFCFMAQPKLGDSATHMHEVLLEAFCYENDIYIVKIDSAEKLSRLLGIQTIESCALLQKSWIAEHNIENMTNCENIIVDYCETFWDAPIQPIVQLPDT